MKITKKRFLQLVKEELALYKEGWRGDPARYPGATGGSTGQMTVGEIERAFEATGVQGLLYGHAVDLMRTFDEKNLNLRELKQQLDQLPHNTKTTGRPDSAVAWVYKQVG